MIKGKPLTRKYYTGMEIIYRSKQWCHDTQHNYIQYNNAQQNDIQHNNPQSDYIQHKIKKMRH